MFWAHPAEEMLGSPWPLGRARWSSLWEDAFSIRHYEAACAVHPAYRLMASNGIPPNAARFQLKERSAKIESGFGPITRLYYWKDESMILSLSRLTGSSPRAAGGSCAARKPFVCGEAAAQGCLVYRAFLRDRPAPRPHTAAKFRFVGWRIRFAGRFRDPADCALVCERDRRPRGRGASNYTTDTAGGAVCWRRARPARDSG